MLSNHNDSIIIRQYLLGKLVDAERDRFEERLFADDELVGELLATEDELIDSSIAGELGQEEAESFASAFLVTPERQQKLRFRKALQGAAKAHGKHPDPIPIPNPSSGHKWIYWATASVAAVLLMTGIISTTRWSRGADVDLTLTAGSSVRSPGRAPDRISLPRQNDTLKLHLVLPQTQITARDYRVVMTSDDRNTRTLTPVAHNGQVLDVAIPAAHLSRHTYTIEVYAVKPDGNGERLPGNYLLAID